MMLTNITSNLLADIPPMNERDLRRQSLFEMDSTVLLDLEEKAKSEGYLLDGCNKKVTLRLLDEALYRQAHSEGNNIHGSKPTNVFALMSLILGGAIAGCITVGFLLVNK